VSEGLAAELARRLRASLDDPRHLAEELIREKLSYAGPFLGDGTLECPWIVFDGEGGGFYALYLRGRQLVQTVSGRPDAVVCVLRAHEGA